MARLQYFVLDPILRSTKYSALPYYEVQAMMLELHFGAVYPLHRCVDVCSSHLLFSLEKATAHDPVCCTIP